MTDAPELVIDVQGLTKTFGPRTVVDHLDLRVPRGAIYGFLGPNGSGKTTTIRMVCGLLKADAGSGTCLGYDVIHQSALIKERVGYMTQKFSLYEDLSIRENLEFVARLYHLPDLKTRVDQALSDLGLSERATQLAGRLSGGWKQRLALAACMIHSPDLLLLDEPTAGVDPKARRDFWDQIRRFSAAGVTTLVSTHYMDEAQQCDSIAYIAYGKKLIDARTRDIPGQIGLSAVEIDAPNLNVISDALNKSKAVELVARFGTTLRACGPEPRALLLACEQACASQPTATIKPVTLGLEEIFIHLMNQSEDNMR